MPQKGESIVFSGVPPLFLDSTALFGLAALLCFHDLADLAAFQDINALPGAIHDTC